MTIAVFLMALLPPTLFLIAAGFALGLFWGPMMPLINTLVQRRVAPDAQGRVFGLQLSLFYAAPPLGMLLSGIAIESVGLPITYLVVAAALAVTSIGVSFAPPIYAIDD